jgi:hypothetical protein
LVRLVTGENGESKVLGPLPVLFAGVGSCAEKALAEFARLARDLTVPIQGPFGLALVDPLGEVMFTGDWPWLADFRAPESLPSQERSESIGADREKLTPSLSGLMRRLRAIEPSVDAAGSGRIRMSSYVLVDLSVAGAIPAAVEVIRTLRQTDPAHDMTVLGLTARTAATDAAADNTWFDGWTRLLGQLQDEPCTQRIYLLDGCDADKMWFERPEQLYRLSAEFLLYHGLTCRTLLRQNERAITGANENLLNVCGSFGCHTIQMDLSMVAERIAERLAREDLSDLYKRTVPNGWLESLEEQAQTLVDRIAAVCEKAYQTQSALSGTRRDPPASLSAGADLSEAITKVVAHVCSREPLVSLCHFFKCLEPRLEKLVTRQRLWERIRTRRLALEAFRRQEENTYEPLRQWLADPETKWADRFTPEQGDPPQVVVSRPARIGNYLLGCLILALGLAGVMVGSLWPDRLLTIGGGLLAIASSALMTAPTGWVRHTRGRIREGQDVAESATPALYRRRAATQTLWLAGGLVAAGLAGVVWPAWPAVWTTATGIWAGVLAVLAGVGVLFTAGAPPETRPDRVSDEEAPDHANPPVGYCRAAGLLCLALAWTFLWWRSPLPVGGITVAWGIQLAGVLLVATGLALVLFPRAGHAYLVDRVPRMPQPLAGGIGWRLEANEMGHRIGAMAAWVRQLAVEPAQCLRRFKTTDALRERETLFDFLAVDWDRQLAEAVRRELKVRSDKNLRTLALQPVLWTECVSKELLDPHAKCPDLTSLFALQAVRAWIESQSLQDLLSYLTVDFERFRRLTGRLACPHWPATRVDPDMSASLVAVGKPLWDVLASRAPSSAPVVPLDWDSDAGVVLALRVVQGLRQGWRGFPGMPGQSPEHLPAAPAQAHPGESGANTAESPSGGATGFPDARERS